MKIILNLESLRPPITGIGVYTQQLVKNLQMHPAISSLCCFNDSGLLDPNEVIENPGNGRGHALRRFLRGLPFTYQMLSTLRSYRFRRHTAKIKDAIYHEPSFVLKPYDGLCIATIHDLSYIHYAKYHPRERVKYLEREIPKTLERAAHIITDSEYVRREIIDILRVAENKVTSIPLGVDQRFFARSRSDVIPTLKRYGLQDVRYLLLVGTFEPRKNISGMLQAYSRLPNELRNKYPLVHVGPVGWRARQTEKAFDDLINLGQARRIGYVSSNDMAYIYAGAHAFAFPSIYEGFGLPLLEAMACGVPVLSSNRSSMPEVVGEAGLLIDPVDIDALTSALVKLLSDEQFRESAKRKGEIQVKHFRWEDCVNKTVNVYQKVGGGGIVCSYLPCRISLDRGLQGNDNACFACI
ncbi:MAG: glycosyltransferase family 4 protein [Sulfuricaulis sp.]